jgi:N-acetyl-gamma-glutamylphosphate reductase
MDRGGGQAMNWAKELSEIVEKVAPYAFEQKPKESEMHHLCAYIVDKVESLLLECSHHMHWQGLLAGLETAGADLSSYELNKSLDKFFSERKFRDWENQRNGNQKESI